MAKFWNAPYFIQVKVKMKSDYNERWTFILQGIKTMAITAVPYLLLLYTQPLHHSHTTLSPITSKALLPVRTVQGVHKLCLPKNFCGNRFVIFPALV